MSSFLNGLASAGLGYYKGIDEQRAMEERKAKQAQEKQLYDIRLQEAKNNAEDNARARADQQTLRAAARPVQATEDGSDGMVRPDTMDNRDVGLAENAGLPNQGLVQSRYNVAGQRFADKTAADAYAQTQNTPDMQASRYATAQRGIGDVAGAYKTESDQRARKKQFEVDAVDNMLKDYGKALFSGGPKALAEMASKSNVDGSDYRHETGPNGEDVYYQVNRSTQKPTLIGSFPGNQQGRVETYRAFASTVSPEIAMKHYAEKKAEDKFDKEAKRKENEDVSQADLRAAQARAADANAKLHQSQANYAALPDATSKKMDEQDYKQRIKGIQDDGRELKKTIHKTMADSMLATDEKKALLNSFEADLRALAIKEKTIQSQFDRNKSGGAAMTSDPLLLREKSVAAQNEPPYDERQTPQRRAEQDAIAAQRELDREKDPKVRTILQAEVDKARRLASQPLPAAAAAGLAQAKPAEPIATPQKKEMSPIDTAGEKVDIARSKLQALKNTKPPGLNDGISARERYASEIENAKKEVDSALVEYQKILPKQIGAPFKLPQDLAKR
jgi:hypothetical protein